jgi:sugar O-acyltransferase (sialic acid O-acetyltransferase NeuD family)
MKRKVVLVGAGGAGRELAYSLVKNQEWEAIGYVDDTIPAGTMVNGLPVFGGIDWLQNYQGNVAVCIVNNPHIKEKIIDRISNNIYISFPVIKHYDVSMSDTVSLGEGTIIAHLNTQITVNVSVARHVWINTRFDLGHDSYVGEFTTVFTNVTVGGDVRIGSHCVLGSGSIIKPGTTIGNNVYIGGGAVVVKDVPDNVVVAGNPAKYLKDNPSGGL